MPPHHRQPLQHAHVSTEPEKAGVSIGEQFPPDTGGGGGGTAADATRWFFTFL